MAEPMKITARFFARSILLSTAFVLTTICTLTLATVQPASAQTYQVIYNFSGEFAGANPQNGLTVDRGENLYGVTVSGGLQDCALLSECGVVFELSRRSFSGWVLVGDTPSTATMVRVRRVRLPLAPTVLSTVPRNSAGQGSKLVVPKVKATESFIE